METRFDIILNSRPHPSWLNVGWFAHAIVVSSGGAAALSAWGYGPAVCVSWGMLTALGGLVAGFWLFKKLFGVPTTLIITPIGLTVLDQQSGEETRILFGFLAGYGLVEYGLLNQYERGWQSLWFKLTDGRRVSLRALRKISAPFSSQPLGPVAEAFGVAWARHQKQSGVPEREKSQLEKLSTWFWG